MKNSKIVIVSAALSVGCVLAGGCSRLANLGSDTTTGSLSDRAGMSKDELMTKGKDLVMQGRSMQSNANNLPDGQSQDGMSKADMLAKAKDLISQGEAMITKAKAM